MAQIYNSAETPEEWEARQKTAREIFDAREDERIMSPLEGFWIAATPTDPEPADQTFLSVCERARFYPGRLDEAIRVRMARLNHLGHGREAEIAGPFAEAYAATIGPAAAASKAIARRDRRLMAAGGVVANARDLCGLSFIQHCHEHGSHWGSVDILFDTNLFMPNAHKSFLTAPPKAQQICREHCAAAADALLDRIEILWGLPQALARHSRDDDRVHWGSDYVPSCQDPEPDRLALVALEGFILSNATPAALPGAKRPGL